VLDFTRYQQGPWATLYLADLGADVLKIEDPGIGDYGRRMFREPDGFSPFFEALDRGKRSVCIDLRHPAGRDLVLQMVDRADVLAENFRPGTMDSFGLGWDVLHARNPRLVYGQATGWGTQGPMAEQPAFDQIVQAYSGFAQQAGGGPGHRPEIPFPGVADQTGGMNFALGIMTALYVREHTGRGQRVEVSLLGTQLALQAPTLQYTLRHGIERPRPFRSSPTVGHYECSDGRWVMIAGIDQKFWPRIAKAVEREDLVHDPRFARGGGRTANRDALEAEMATAFRTRPSAYWLARLKEHDVPASPVRGHEDLLTDEQVAANGYIQSVDHPKWGTLKVVGPHINLSETPAHVAGPATPGHGEHTREVLRELGLDDDRIRALEAAGTVGTSPPG